MILFTYRQGAERLEGTIMAKHLERETQPLDLTDGETAAYVNDATRLLSLMLSAARARDNDGLGGGGPLDNAAHLIGLLSGSFDGGQAEYALELWHAAACKIVDANEDLAHWL